MKKKEKEGSAFNLFLLVIIFDIALQHKSIYHCWKRELLGIVSFDLNMLRLLLVFVILQVAFGFAPVQLGWRNRATSPLSAIKDDEFAQLTKKLSQKVVEKASSPSVQEEKKIEEPAVVAAPTTTTPTSVSSAKVATKAAPAKTEVEKKVEQAAKTVITKPAVQGKTQTATTTAVKVVVAQPAQPSDSLSTVEYLQGIGLGAAPFLIIPVLLFNAFSGTIKKVGGILQKTSNKPDSVTKVSAKVAAEPVKPVKKVVETYNKPLLEGAKEGINDLVSGKVSADLQETRRALKYAGGAFAASIVFGGLLLTVGGGEGAESKSPPKDVSIITLYLITELFD